ncbi:MAG: ABC transporter ATP-binding protein [Planctomycetaceae bacterium]|nr:ABC transporter ATP-binding protein [Planctomycetaceae bacterium]
MSTSERYLELSQLTKSYPSPTGATVIVENFNLQMRAGEFVSLIGHSGCGKSTVLSMVAGLNPVSSGGVILAGKEVVGPGTDRGVVFQSPSLLPWMTALQNVQLGVDQTRSNRPIAERREAAIHHLRLVGLGESIHKYPRELSQGMRQRVGLARAFALSPRLLLLDEPFGMLDSLTRYELQGVLVDVCLKENTTALMVTHDVDEALLLSDRVVMMTNGPNAKVGDILDVPFDRPRYRDELLDHRDYYRLREYLVGFLEGQARGHESGCSTKSQSEVEAMTTVVA